MIPYEDQLECARRELKLRKQVYPRRVANGQMTQQLADKETSRMAAIVETLERLAQGERLI